MPLPASYQQCLPAHQTGTEGNVSYDFLLKGTLSRELSIKIIKIKIKIMIYNYLKAKFWRQMNIRLFFVKLGMAPPTMVTRLVLKKKSILDFCNSEN
jgi:hypothetical protein